jgi:hypothetical protein
MITKDTAYQNITELVQRFDEQKDSYKKADYNETLVRRDFIDPFFKSLGWDMDNSQSYAEAYREVIHEDRVKIGSATKAPDYSFRLPGGKRLFFVEAKKPSVFVKNDILPAYQVRRYAWSAKLPVSILTDFEEFAVYDCNKKPKPDDKASTGRIKYITYSDYLNEFDFIWDTFSKERVLKGSFDKFVASDIGKKGTTTVDKDFLESLDKWRLELAYNIALRNPSFNEDDLNYAVQQTIDRIIFLRIAEDRGVEEYGRLKATLKGENFYDNLFSLFKEADSKYNSGLFDFKKDKLSKELQLDNKVLKSIFNELYYPVSPYEFSVLSVEILGSAYEQFLGKQIKLTDRHKAQIEEKPEVRKAGGVYYTPQYIVDYIVQQTVGKMVEGKKPADVAKLKIVDPACGSGSFLIGAYQYLLNWHHNYYKPEFERLTAIASNSSEYNEKQRLAAQKERNKLPLTPDGALTSALKKQILLNNIYGVDIDTQAVEVTKLSLLLKCMEGETQSSINAEMRFGERILPTLDANIKSGNSLIDLDFYDGEFDFEPGADKKIKPFSWEKAFPEVFKNGGFDVVIGNPPYIPIEFFSNEERIYYREKYEEVNRKYDTSILFTMSGLRLLTKKGLLGFISTQTWQTGENFNELRKKLFNRYGVMEIINLPYDVFKDAYVDTGIFIYSKENQKSYNFYSYSKKAKIGKIENIAFENISTSKIKQPEYKLVFNKSVSSILGKLSPDKFVSLGSLTISTQGLSESRFPKASNLKEGNVLPFIQATVKRYVFSEEKRYLVNLDSFKSLRQFYVSAEKILIRRIINRQDRIDATYFNKEGVFKKDLNPFIVTDKNYDSKFVLGLINSKLFSWLYINTSSIATKDDFRQTTLAELRKLPIKVVEKRQQNEIVALVDTMLSLNKEKQQTTLPEKLEGLQHRINHTDDKINSLVYQLYGLTEEEIKIVEGNH